MQRIVDYNFLSKLVRISCNAAGDVHLSYAFLCNTKIFIFCWHWHVAEKQQQHTNTHTYTQNELLCFHCAKCVHESVTRLP